jgi:DNA repair exonuclease SbcCD ATPase subunit
MMPGFLGETPEREMFSGSAAQELSSIDSALARYNQIRSQYTQILEQAIRTQDPQERARLVSTITQMNQQLSTIVASLQQMYQSGEKTLSGMPPIDFEADLAQYKSDLEELMTQKDELSRLKTVHSTLTSSATTANPSYIYVIVIFIMLIILLIMFTFTSLMTGASSVISSIPVPTIPDLGISAPAPSSVM